MDRTVVIRGLTRIITKADNHDNGMTYEVSLYRSEYEAIEEAIRLLEVDEKDEHTCSECDDCQQFDCYGCEYAERKEE